ncbi:DUF805 domain-containing protein [Flavisericum labens]|uniref:DUF805 domain-containing protein n=1 Tax=Flavisericum labens TaxID=3377112 RepID=UPI00387B9CDF
MFKNPFSFKGRIRRLEYGLSYLAYMIFANFADLIYLTLDIQISEIINLIILLPSVYFILAQGAKRCHDRGNSGWYQIIPFYVFWMVFADSDYGPNEYGDNPKDNGNHDPIEEIGVPVEIEELKSNN